MIKFNEKWFKSATKKEVEELYKGRTDVIQERALTLWRKFHPKKTKK